VFELWWKWYLAEAPVHFPLQLAAQLASLDEQKERLGERTTDLRPLIDHYLVSPLLEFELSKVRHPQAGAPGPEQGQREVSRSQGEVLLSAVMDLTKAIGELASTDLLHLQELLTPDQEDSYRKSSIQPLSTTHQPVDPALIPGAMDRFFEWVRSPGFADMHAVGQMSLSQMRLYEISPFVRHSPLIVSLFSYYFLLKGKYLVPLYKVEELPQFYQALKEAFQLSSEALVRFNAQACQRAYEHVLSKVG
jgi:hypothetical protein